ncbi:MAG: ANTAR domain-containing response regulator [Oscillospiraceae bacterium]
MARVVVVFENEKNRERIADMLSSGGVDIRLVCRSGAEAIRAIHNMGSGLVVCSHKMVDMNASDLSFNLSGIGIVLVVGTAAQLDLCDGNDLFKIATPLSRSDLLASVSMLLQLEEQVHGKIVPTRTEDEKRTIARAKSLLMERNLMTEDQAHRFIQKLSMDTGSKMVDTARKILSTAS